MGNQAIIFRRATKIKEPTCVNIRKMQTTHQIPSLHLTASLTGILIFLSRAALEFYRSRKQTHKQQKPQAETTEALLVFNSS